MNEMVTKNTMDKIQKMNAVCKELVNTPHYKKLGEVGIRTIVEKSDSMGVDILDALNGGFYFVQGKVEMSSQMMNQLIRMHKHSIQKDPKSDDTICILIGRRSDNGDVWTESFSIEDAKKAGIYSNVWLKYPKDMLFARALSRLARQLFPDVIHGCYVQGEIIADVEKIEKIETVEVEVKEEKITEEQALALEEYLFDNAPLKEKMLNYLKDKYAISSFKDMPVKAYEGCLKRAKEEFKKREEVAEVLNDQD